MAQAARQLFEHLREAVLQEAAKVVADYSFVDVELDVLNSRFAGHRGQTVQAGTVYTEHDGAKMDLRGMSKRESKFANQLMPTASSQPAS